MFQRSLESLNSSITNVQIQYKFFYIDKHVWFLLQMQEVQQSKETTLANNRTLAEQNLALQPQLEHKKEELTKHYRGLQEEFESYQLRKSTLGMAAFCLLIYSSLDFRIRLQTVKLPVTSGAGPRQTPPP